MAEVAASTLDSMAKRFEAQNNVSQLHQSVMDNVDLIDSCTKKRDLRRRNALTRDNERMQREIQRRQRKRSLFEILSTDVQEAAQITDARQKHRKIECIAPKDKVKREKDLKEEMHAILEDIILIDDGQSLQDARAQVDDVCTNCGTLMERNLQLSYLVCPNLECGMCRWYLDTSTYQSSTYSVRSENLKTAPKCVTHYSTFLNVSMGKSTKRFSRDYLMRIAHYCYVEGCRKKEDITKEVVNKAQKYLGPTEYNLSTLLKTQLRGDCLRLPPEIIKRLQLLFKALWPVFASLKASLDSDRSNMINFNYMSRVLCRLLGYDIFLPLFDKFRMQRNEVRHSAFMRLMFRKLDWHWEDGRITDIPDSVLDEFEKREGCLVSDTGGGEVTGELNNV